MSREDKRNLHGVVVELRHQAMIRQRAPRLELSEHRYVGGVDTRKLLGEELRGLENPSSIVLQSCMNL